MAAGTGMVSFAFNPTSGLGELVKVDAATGAITSLSEPCQTTSLGFLAADARSDGMVFAVADDLYRLDVASGNCAKVATPPEALGTVAVRGDGTVVAISRAGTAGRFTLYVFDANGVNNAGATQTIAGTYISVKGIDFGPDGTLYMLAHDTSDLVGMWTLDPSTGAVQSRYAAGSLVGDIDIDAAGNLRGNGSDLQSVRTLDYQTGAQTATATTSRQTQKLVVVR